jgi:hypothetical protein
VSRKQGLKSVRVTWNGVVLSRVPESVCDLRLKASCAKSRSSWSSIPALPPAIGDYDELT